MGKIIGFFFGLVLVLGVALALFEVDFKPRFPGGSRMENLQAAVLEALGDAHNATENLATEKTLPEESRPEQPPPEQEVVVQQIPAAQPVEKRAEREQPEAPAETLEDTAQAPLDPTDAEPPAPLGGAEIGGQQAEALAPGKTLQVFWKPFETRTSARGFATTINKLTGLEIEVVRQDDDRFVVAYFYNGEEERQQNASLIEESARIKIDLEAGNEP